jgi:hypothetical protein
MSDDLAAREWLGKFLEANGIEWEKLSTGQRWRMTSLIPCTVRCWRVGVPVPEAVAGTKCPECGKEIPKLTSWEVLELLKIGDDEPAVV